MRAYVYSPSSLLRARNSAPSDSAGETLFIPLTEPWENHGES